MIKSNKLYSDEFLPIVHNISGVYIPFDLKWEKIGVCLSGGADSALLTYLVCSIIETHKLPTVVHVIANIRMWKDRPWQEFTSLQVYNWFVNRFPTISFNRHINFVPQQLEWGNTGPIVTDITGKRRSGDEIELIEYSEYVAFRNKLNAWYSGQTKNPSDPLISDRPPGRDEEVTSLTKPKSVITHYNNLIACHPFRFVEKDWIMSQYYNFQLFELLNLTRSCEGDNIQFPEIFNGLDYQSYIPGQAVPECGKCFWCQERNWGIANRF